MDDTHANRPLRIELMDGEEARAIVAAIEAQHDDATVEELPGLITVSAHGSIAIDRDRVEEELGRPFNLRDIQGILAAYCGFWKQSSTERWVLEWVENQPDQPVKGAQR